MADINRSINSETDNRKNVDKINLNVLTRAKDDINRPLATPIDIVHFLSIPKVTLHPTALLINAKTSKTHLMAYTNKTVLIKRQNRPLLFLIVRFC